jgi:hypothetical protein
MAMGIFHAIRGTTARSDYPDEFRADSQYLPEPVIEPGQIWLVECDPAALSPVHASLLRHANVVLYEGVLGAALAESLPTGIYAERLSAIGAPGPAIAPRARRFAADGWSVLQLIERRPDWRLPGVAAEELLRQCGRKSPLLAIGTIRASRYRQTRGNATNLAIVAAELGSDELLSLIFAPSGPRSPASGQAFTANGLAG